MKLVNELTPRQVVERVKNETGLEISTHVLARHREKGFIKSENFNGSNRTTYPETEVNAYIKQYKKIVELRAKGWRTGGEWREQYGSRPSIVAGYKRIPKKNLRKKILSWEFLNPEYMFALYHGQYKPVEKPQLPEPTPEQKDPHMCLYEGCKNPALPGTEYGFRFCEKHEQQRRKIMDRPRSETIAENSRFMFTGRREHKQPQPA